MSTLVERLDDIWTTHDLPVEVMNAVDEARATITRLEEERDDALKDNKKLRMMMEAREKLQDAFGVDMHQNATETALEFAQREIDAVARAEAAEAEVERLKSDVDDLVRAGSDEATENARLREALRAIEIEATREGGKWVHMRRVIAVQSRAALTGDLTNG